MKKEFVALCAIAKNEGLYMREWVAFHLALGFDKIIIYDNDSSNKDLRVYSTIKSKQVEIRNWPTQSGEAPQIPAYNHFLNEDGHLYDWIIFLDLDEFLNLKKHDDIHQFLSEYQDYSAIAINWRIFGSSGLKKYDGRLVTDRFEKASPIGFGPNAHVKTIFRPKAAESAGVHSPHLKSDMIIVNTDKKILNPAANELQFNICFDTAQVNHYVTKSFDEFIYKRLRGRADIAAGKAEKYRTENDFYSYDLNNDLDQSIHRFRDRLLLQYSKIFDKPPQLRNLFFWGRRLYLSASGAQR